MKTLYYFLIFFLATGTLFAQQTEITGTVTSSVDGLPIPGVNILIVGTKIGTNTDFDGYYRLTANKEDILQFSFLGYQTKTIKFNGNNTAINVVMEEDTSELDEVVVVGYGIKRKSYVTGSASVIKGNSIKSSRRTRKSQKRRKSKNIEGIKGKITGVQMNTATGNVGNAPKILIRGTSSTTVGSAPLIVVDGVPTNASLSSINPTEIKNIDVLRDSSATAIYGNRGSNGVILVTTKSGKRALQESIINESYEEITENNFERTQLSPLSTFSIDVDKASYSNVRRMINNGMSVPADAVKIEEMINYFDYAYEQPKGDHPFAIHTEYATTPWNENTELVKIGLKGKEIAQDAIPASNLVFLLDVSGSMNNTNKLPLLKKACKLLVHQLREKDKVSIVVYAGAAGVVLKPTSGAHKDRINQALDNLNAGGSTAGGEGIQLAYKIAQENFIKNGNNRVILATDGDFNVGMSSDKDMETLIEEKRKSNVFLTCLGFGMGNYKDSKLETLADKGNGNHSYIDTMQEAQRVLGKEFGGTLYAIAKDVKIQVEFNPAKVQAYRLIGYENRLLADEDFVDDTKDAGELGSGHTVTALYEVIPVGIKSDYLNKIPDLKYTNTKIDKTYGDELLTVKFRYKKPQENKSIEMIHTLRSEKSEVSQDFKFAASVAWFGMKIRNSKYIANKKHKDIVALAQENKDIDSQGYRAEFVRLMNSYLTM